MKQDRSAIDGYTFVHMGFGYGAKKMGLNNSQILILAIVYEMIEPSIIKYMREELKLDVWGYESRQNIVVDVIAAYVGAKLGGGK